MALSRRSGLSREVNAWPGWVDALSSLVIVVIFVLMVFIVGQAFLQGTLMKRDATLAQLNHQLAALNALLGNTRADRDAVAARLKAAEDQLTALASERDSVKADAATQVAILNQQIAELRDQLERITAALQLAETGAQAKDATIADLTQKLNAALATRVEELARYRSEFFGRLRDVLGNRPDIRIVGDRFVFQSEVLFPSGSAQLEEQGKAQLAQLAATLLQISQNIPPGVNWILRVDGHTDRRPIRTAEFPSNWALSTARAVAVVQFLASQGIPPERLAAAGFGEYQPIDAGTDDGAFARNRRIELKLDQR